VSQEYDPFAAIERVAEVISTSDELSEQRRATEHEWNVAWEAAIRDLNIDRFLELGHVLRSSDAAFWLERLECNLARDRHVVETLKYGHIDTFFGFPQSVISLRLLKSAFIESAAGLQADLQKIDARLSPGVQGALDDYRATLALQVRGHAVPPTPLMTKTELGIACRAKVPGLDASGITKKIQAGELHLHGNFGPERGRFHRFELLCPGGARHMQLLILKLSVLQIRRCKKTSFFSSPVWTAKKSDL
jgi:hypothetical protein